MQSVSVGLVATVLIAVGLVIVLGIALASPLFAIVIFLFVFAGFLVWRGRERAPTTGSSAGRREVPTTEEAAADPVADSSVPDATRVKARSGSR
jgi:hypothetical protein